MRGHTVPLSRVTLSQPPQQPASPRLYRPLLLRSNPASSTVRSPCNHNTLTYASHSLIEDERLPLPPLILEVERLARVRRGIVESPTSSTSRLLPPSSFSSSERRLCADFRISSFPHADHSRHAVLQSTNTTSCRRRKTPRRPYPLARSHSCINYSPSYQVA